MALQSTKLTRYSNSIRKELSAFLWQQPLSTQSFWKRFLLRSLQILFGVLRDLTQGQISLRAMSLVFTTVLGFVPLLALTFSVLKSLGVHNAMEPTLLTLLEPLGERSSEVTNQILGFVDNIQVELIGITSTGFLIFVVLDMMRKIEVSFNYIWAVKQARSWSNRIREYLFAVIVSPLLLFLSISITSSVNTSFFQRFLTELAYGSMVLEIFAFVAPILFMSLAFAFAYSFLPNTKVQFSSAFIGGLVTTIIWKLMGSLFQGFFISAARESIYLAFATAIAVMFMAYVLWLVALVGSSIAFYHQYPAKIRIGRERLKLGIGQFGYTTFS
jgi:membrane protein